MRLEPFIPFWISICACIDESAKNAHRSRAVAHFTSAPAKPFQGISRAIHVATDFIPSFEGMLCCSPRGGGDWLESAIVIHWFPSIALRTYCGLRTAPKLGASPPVVTLPPFCCVFATGATLIGS